MAVPHGPVATRPGGAPGEGLLRAEAHPGDSHLGERAQLSDACSGPAPPRGRRERRPPVRRRARGSWWIRVL